jgi:hypothetical protein
VSLFLILKLNTLNVTFPEIIAVRNVLATNAIHNDLVDGLSEYVRETEYNEEEDEESLYEEKNKEIKVKVMSFEGLDDDISVSSIDSEIMASNVRISQHISVCLMFESVIAVVFQSIFHYKTH